MNHAFRAGPGGSGGAAFTRMPTVQAGSSSTAVRCALWAKFAVAVALLLALLTLGGNSDHHPQLDDIPVGATTSEAADASAEVAALVALGGCALLVLCSAALINRWRAFPEHDVAATAKSAPLRPLPLASGRIPVPSLIALCISRT